MEKITSLTNNFVKYLCKFNKKKFRDEEGLFLVESEHLVEEAKKLNLVDTIITTSEELISSNYKTYLVTKEIMKKVSNLESPSNIMALVKIPDTKQIRGNVLLLDRLQDPGNLGTIIRSAVAFNIDTIILGEGTVDAYNDKTIRSSEGMIFHLNIISRNLNEIINELKSSNYRIIGTKVTGGKDVKKLDLSTNYAIIIGNEGQGVSDTILNTCDDFIYINMNQECESLNAGVAASILMYELNNKLGDK